MRDDTLGGTLTPGGEYQIFVRRQLRSHRFGKSPFRSAKTKSVSFAPQVHALFREGVQQIHCLAHNTPSSNSLSDEPTAALASTGCAATSSCITQSVNSKSVGPWMRRAIATLTPRSASIWFFSSIDISESNPRFTIGFSRSTETKGTLRMRAICFAR